MYVNLVCIAMLCCRNERDQPQRKRRKNESKISTDSFAEDSSEAERGGKKRRRGEARVAGEEGEEGASWEGVRMGGGGEGDGDVHYLLPLKTRGGLVLQPPVPNPNSTYDV